MEQNMETILSALAEKIRELELQLRLRDYDIKNLNKDNERLKKENEELNWHLNPILKKEEKEDAEEL